MGQYLSRFAYFLTLGCVVGAGCTTQDQSARLIPLEQGDFEIIRTWLLCGDCLEGERGAVQSLGTRAIPALAEMFYEVPEFVMEPLRRGVLRLWDPDIYPDSAAYFDRFLGNAVASVRLKAALSLGDVGADEELLRDLLDTANARGYDQEVINALQWAIETEPGAEATVESISIIPDAVTVPRGSVGGLAVSVQGPYSQPSAATVAWESLDLSVVTVDAGGVFTALSEGTARIVASAGSWADTAQVTVVSSVQPNQVVRILGGNNQAGPVANVLPEALRIAVTDPGDHFVQVQVHWTILQGGGSVSAPVTTTNAVGLTTNLWRLGDAPGRQRLEARVAGGPAVVFRAEATPGDPVHLEIRLAGQGTAPPVAAPDTLRLSVGEVLRISAFLTDARGNGWEPASPRGVSWSSSADSIARFLASGTLLAVRGGYATIGVMTGGLVAHKPVIVSMP